MVKMRSIVLAAFMATGVAGAQQIVGAQDTSQPEVQAKASFVEVKQVKDDLFAGTEKFAAGASDVTEVNLDPKMMGMLGGKNAVASLAHKMNFIVVHTYTYDKPGQYRMEDVEAYRRKLTDGTWNCSIHVRDKKESTDICSRTASDHESTEMVVLTAEPQELTFIHMSGRMSLDDLTQMGGAMGQSRGLKRR